MSKQGVLLINLGSPDSPSIPDVRKYLREFLMDRHVLDAPWPVRAFIVYGCILPFRPKHSAEAYTQIWTPEGSPLIATSRRVQCGLQQRLGPDFAVELAMRYQNPSIESAIAALHAQGITDVFVIPLFPHYAMSSYGTAVIRAQEIAARQAPGMRLKIAKPYYEEPAYIQALAASASEFLRKDYDHLLFSFHGLPERHLRKADPTHSHCLGSSDCCERPSLAHQTCYRAQCFSTVRAFTCAAGVPPEKVSIAFQSRLGRDPWLKPYADLEWKRLAESGVKKLLVICPAFVSDCLETLEEVAIRGRNTFLQSGGNEFTLIPCLNDHPQWICALESMVRTASPCAAELS